MRNFYIFSYASGLLTSTGYAGYHGHFSIAGSLTIFSTKEKAHAHMDRLTSLAPECIHRFMNKAEARKHRLGDSMEEFTYFIENNVDLNVPEEKEEGEEIGKIRIKLEEGEADNIIGKFLITHINEEGNGLDDNYRGIFVADTPNFYSDKEEREAVNLIIYSDLDFNKVASFVEEKGEENSSNFSEILESMINIDAKVFYKGDFTRDFYLEYEDDTGHKTHIAVGLHPEYNCFLQLHSGD